VPSPTEQLAARGLTLPRPTQPLYSYVPVTRHDDLLYVSGQVPKVDGELRVAGLVGADVTLEEAREGARICALNGLAQLAAFAGGLDAIARIVRVTGFVASAPGFFEQPRVVDAASDLLVEIFGEAGRHARSAVGVAALPSNASVEVELIATLAGERR
jgi:enamine deaminase RidA (YjgF/YER057c/UK114 family)